MEKPRKKETYEHRELNGMVEVDLRYNAGWNACHDAMSTWIDGQVPTVEEIKTLNIWKVVIKGYLDEHLQEGCLEELAKDLHDGLKRKLTGN